MKVKYGKTSSKKLSISEHVHFCMIVCARQVEKGDEEITAVHKAPMFDYIYVFQLSFELVAVNQTNAWLSFTL